MFLLKNKPKYSHTSIAINISLCNEIVFQWIFSFYNKNNNYEIQIKTLIN